MLRIAKQGALGQIRHLEIDGEAVPTRPEPWLVMAFGEIAGQVTSVVRSRDIRTDVAIGMVGRDFRGGAKRLEIDAPDGAWTARQREASWL